MYFERKLPAGYPCIYDTWKTDESTWVIQDLTPEDDEAAIEILVNYLVADEVLCSIQNLKDDQLSVQEMCEFWRDCLSQRMSIACHELKDGVRTLVGLNVCIVTHKDELDPYEFKATKWRAVYEALMYAEHKGDCYQYLGTDLVLQAMGLVVRREYRGARLGQKILAARESLAKSQGIIGTATVFTGISSQISAARNGFVTIAEATMNELADNGLPYPRNDERMIKYMVKRFK